jgi:2,4-dienoyl-CoA reductase-like NADH-dependent reductase (Old Yellow Enzyme family)
VSKLFEACRLGSIELKNRVIMAPMTRSRADAQGVPTEMMVEYYAQRASAGLIIAEGTYPSEDGKGYCRTPGIVNAEQIASWRKVTDAVHARGGQIVLQIMHCGRCSHAENKSPDAETVAPSAISVDGEVFTEQGMKPFSPPRALGLEEIAGVIEGFRQATANAYEAGFDGVELHCTSGYLPAQFLSPGSNQRDDAYGGNLENRLRFVKEVLDAMASVKGADRVGLRIGPGITFNDVKDPNPQQTFEALLGTLAPMGLAYLHVMHGGPLDVVALATEVYKGPFIINRGFDKSRAEAAVNDKATAVAFGFPYIANPDLVERMQADYPLNKVDQASIYNPTAEGYVDYPAMDG